MHTTSALQVKMHHSCQLSPGSSSCGRWLAAVRYSVLLVFLALSSLARAQTIVLSVPGPGSLVYLPVQLAVALQADRSEGLELKLRFFSGGPLALRDLADHNSDFSVVGMPAIAASRADRMPILAIGQLSQAAMVSLMVRTDLKDKVHSVAQLKGMRVGVNTSTRSSRSTSQMLAQYVLQRAGLNEGDVQMIPAGQTLAAQQSALQSRTVDAVMGDEPFASELAALGVSSILVDLYNPQTSRELLGGPFIHAALATREDVLAQHAQTVQKVQRMFDRTLRWLDQHTAQEVMAQLAGQPGFASKKNQILLAVLQRNPKMYPQQTAWDVSALDSTEKFFHTMAQEDAETALRFTEFVRTIATRGGS